MGPRRLRIFGRIFAGVLLTVVAASFANGAPASREHALITANAATSTQGGINVEPSARPWQYVGANPDSWWCPSASSCTTSDPLGRINTETGLAQQLHVANVRLEIPWFLVEPSRGGYDWSRADYIFNSASAHGIVIQPILVYTPAWSSGAYNAFPVAADFQAFVTAFMGRYGSRIHAVEMWNEPDGGQSLASNNPGLYVQDILKPGYQAVKATYPVVSVIEGGSINDSGVCCSWLSGVLGAGGGSYFDIAAFHDYGGNYAQVAAAYRGLVGGRPIWLGEYGVSDATGSQQTSLIQAALAGTPGIAMAQFYTLRDESVYTCCPPAATGEHKQYGLLTATYSPKSSFFTTQSLLGGTSPPPPPPPPPASPSPTPTPQASPSPTPTASGAGHSPSSAGGTGSSHTSSGAGASSPFGQTPGAATALVSALSFGSRGEAGIRIVAMGFVLVGLVGFGWGASLATNIGALGRPAPRPPLFKSNPALGIGLAVGSVLVLAFAVLLVSRPHLL
jgi:hypothetical protein